MVSQHGSKPYAILLCYASDLAGNVARQAVSHFDGLFLNDPRGMAAYWREVSYGNIDLKGSKIFGWKKLSKTTAQLQMLGRGAKVSAIADEFANDADRRKRVDFSGFYGIIAVVVPDVDFGATTATVMPTGGTAFKRPAMIANQQSDLAGYAHEMGHTLGFDHSFDDDPMAHDPANDGRPGAYGDTWDAMSYANNLRFPVAPYGTAGPGLNVVNLGLAGWVSPARLLTPGSGTVEIAAVNTPGTAPIGLVVGGSTFEFRMNDGFDAGFAGPAVFRHTEGFDSGEHSVLHRQNPFTFEFQPGDFWESGQASNVFSVYRRVEVLSFDTKARTAKFAVTVRPARRDVAGPGILFGGVDVGGDGFILINGHIVRVPPRSPVYEALARLAEIQSTSLISEQRLRDAVLKSALHGLQRTVAGIREVRG